jgi:hypothetical protein
MNAMNYIKCAEEEEMPGVLRERDVPAEFAERVRDASEKLGAREVREVDAGEWVERYRAKPIPEKNKIENSTKDSDRFSPE